MTSFGTTNSVSIITDENNSVSLSTPSHWNSKNGEELVNKLNKLLDLRSENDFEVRVKEVKKEVLKNDKRSLKREIENSG